MSQGAQDNHRDALAALERLVNRHRVLTAEEARNAARLITNDPDVQFPPARPPRPEPGQAPMADAPASSPGRPPDMSSNGPRPDVP